MQTTTPVNTQYAQLIEASVGAVVIVNRSFLGQPAGVRALVYEVYEICPGDPGVSLITENGQDLGGFSRDDIERFLTFIGAVELEYVHISAYYLREDLQDGVFTGAFQDLQLLATATNL